MPVEDPPERHLDRVRLRGYIVICLSGVVAFSALTVLSSSTEIQRYIYAASAAGNLLLLLGVLTSRIRAQQVDTILGWGADIGAAVTVWAVSRNLGPMSGQTVAFFGIFLVVWFGVLPLRTASVRAALLVGAVAVIGAVRSPPEPVPVIVFALLALLVGQMTASGRVIRHEASEKAHYANLAMTDMLTGLLNRRALHGAMNAYYAGGTRGAGRTQRTQLGILLLDLDHFKNINDSYGHDVGDSVLQHVAGVLRACAGPDDQVARWGGEEFLMLVITDERADLERRATQIIATLRAIHSGLPPVTVSIGIAHVSEAKDVDNLLRLADRRLYRAKRSGRDRVNKDTLIRLPDEG
ncbi:MULTISPECIES: sensor domain-containing diguanylate cyclase [Deinococcus]|uniref:Diguanylate cyclase n=1 Tax=Deinococcus rufus TaxID=2136097 RepID=A0ABV7Z9Q1_9DEIO|nr:GGDEF domain-containing protein [Deinococcus sp. AB2017081]WQE95670.1 GGDEF domain-containing protein [Deinococcus sp. AB2017081]